MKHPSNREFFAYWDQKRGTERAPDRADIDPAAVRGLLGDIFVLSCEPNLGFPFRVAGTRVCALAGCDLKDASFAALFNEANRREIEEITTVVADESLGAIAGITATREDGSKAHLELLLLPFNARPHTPVSVTGVLAPFDDECGALGPFTLTSWRYLHQPEKLLARAIRKLQIARGLMVYEGLR
ncbi:PAS domain-containing protein [Bradyrhizobium sp. 38]|uniref:PAS domain-containing protein n=1 Tax=unclassified Bradyrhizobium TaxID=2631580 RepID=UPI001FFA0803|nr:MULTISPECIES: PAS domain-containing protein [unclassified Bradyrhizobium]MCK1336303.1 PAS domain-containing protein [Bradyrhizobium sp. 38]MCK1782446.1 PAS domain-containing protein [Bradyrhizobium sp. 132]